jgi:lipoprotein-anchoring transpeptidase ErfK/SrfK
MPIQTGLLQRKCNSCGQHTIAGGECTSCQPKNGLQRKLTIGASNDPLELEADRIADRVLAAPTNNTISTAPPRIQRFTGQTTEQADVAPASVDRVLSSPGRPLEASLQQDMGQRFGHDFSRVRVHTGDEAARSAQDVNAHAYTVGHNIVFGTNQFLPGSNGGRRLLAHELTHVLQQDSANDLQIQRQAESSVQEKTQSKSPSSKKKPETKVVQKIHVDLSTQKMTVTWIDGTIEEHNVSTGRGLPNTKDDPCKTQLEENCTPPGSFNVGKRGDADKTNKKGDKMAWFIGLSGMPPGVDTKNKDNDVGDRGIGIHGSQSVSGVPRSHGCIRVGDSPADDAFAKKINNHVDKDTTTIIITGKAPTKPWKKTVSAKKSKSKSNSKPKGSSKKTSSLWHSNEDMFAGYDLDDEDAINLLLDEDREQENEIV